MARARKVNPGHKVTAESKYAFGTPDEIANRDATGYQNPETAFVQIKPGGSGRNLNEPPHEDVSGYLKFANKT